MQHLEEDQADWQELRFGLTLPLFNWNSGKRKAASLAAKHSDKNREAVVEKLETVLAKGVDDYEIALSDWQMFQKENATLLPRIAKMIQAAKEDSVFRSQAEPTVHVQYIREPYVSHMEDYCRITFDRCLSFRPSGGSYDLASDDAMPYWDDPITTAYPWDDSPVILEIKTETKIPMWIVALIRRFDLVQRGFSKYCNAMDNILCQDQYCDRTCAL